LGDLVVIYSTKFNVESGSYDNSVGYQMVPASMGLEVERLWDHVAVEEYKYLPARGIRPEIAGACQTESIPFLPNDPSLKTTPIWH
jgi:hypothetical protein